MPWFVIYALLIDTKIQTSPHLSDLGIVTQRDCASSTLHFLLLLVHMEWKILIEHIPNPASDKFKAYFIPNFGHICTKI